MLRNTESKSLRYAMILPLALIMASIVTCCVNYFDAKRSIAEDLNQAMMKLASNKSSLLCHQDTIAAIKSMDRAVGQPICYRAGDLKFGITQLADNAYYTLRMANAEIAVAKHFIESDSILLYDRLLGVGSAIELKGYVDCSMATVLAISDKSVPGTLMALAMLSMMIILYCKQREQAIARPLSFSPDYSGIKLTPMQRQLVEMIAAAPGHKMGKRELCLALWGNKSNAEESLYTLVRRSKQALADANFEIICNRGDSYELRPKC